MYNELSSPLSCQWILCLVLVGVTKKKEILQVWCCCRPSVSLAVVAFATSPIFPMDARASTLDTLADFGNEDLCSPFITGTRRRQGSWRQSYKEEVVQRIRKESRRQRRSRSKNKRRIRQRRSCSKNKEKTRKTRKSKTKILLCTHHWTMPMMGTKTTTYSEHYCVVQVLSTKETSPYKTLWILA